MNKELININLFNLNPLPSWIYDYQTLQIFDVNRAAIEHYGYTKEEFLKLNLKDLRPSEEVPKLISSHAIAKNQKGNIYIGIFTHKKKNGSRIQVEINGHKVDFNDRECMLVVCQDITKRIEQEEQILQSEQRFKALVQEGSDMISIIDVNGKYSYTSPTTTAILGITPEEFQNNTVFDFIHPDDMDKAYTYMQRIATEKKVIVEPFRLKDGNKQWRWIETVLTNMLDNPAIGGIVANSRDITKQKEEEQQLRLLSSVVTNTKDSVVITEVEIFDYSGPKIIYVNEAFTKMTGYKASEIIGKTTKVLHGPNTDHEELKKLTNAIEKWESCEITIANYKKNGEEFWNSFKVSPVTDEKGNYTHWIAIQRDVTEQKQKELEKELLGKISLNFSSEKDLLSSSKLLCQTICDYGRFDFVELWMPNIENTKLQLMATKAASTNANIFCELTKNVRSFKLGEGLPGAVWSKKNTLLWEDINKKDDFIRKEAAEKAAIKNASAFPLIFNNQIMGVLLIATQKEIKQLNKHIKLFEQLKQFIGSEMNRKKLENDLGYLYNTIPDILCVTDFQGRFLKINKAACDLLGYTEEEILYNTFEKFVHPEDKNCSKGELENIIKDKITIRFENRYITKNGKVIWLSWTHNASSEEGIIYATAKNITEEKKLKELNRQTRELAKVGGWEYDLIENNLFWSNEVHRLHETDPNTFIPNVDKAIDFYKEDHKAYVIECITKSITQGAYLDYEAIIINNSKKERWVRVIGNPEYENGVCVKFVGSFQDITDRKEEESRLQVLSDNIPGVVYQYIIHPDGQQEVKNASKGAEKIWGYNANQIMSNINLAWNQIKAGGDYTEVKQSIKDSMTSRKNWSCRFRSLDPNGNKKVIQGFGKPEFLIDGTILYNSILLDVTQETKNEELLAQVTKLAKIGSWEVDRIKNEVYWSNTVYELHETDPITFKPDLMNGINFYREDFREMVTEKIAKSLETGIPFDFEAVLVTAKKKERWVRCIGYTELANGTCTRLYGSFQDIQEQKENELRLKSISDDLPGVTFQYIMTPEGKNYMQGVSKAAEKVWNISANDCELNNNLVWDQIKKAGDFEAVQQSIQEAIANNKQWNFQWRNIVPSGEVRWHEGYGTPNILANGTVIFNSLIFDITEKHKAIELYDEVSKMAKIGSWELNLTNSNNTNDMYWSPILKEIVGVDKDYNPSLTAGYEFYTEESKEKISKAVETLMKTGEGFDLELQIETKSKNVKWIRCIGKAEFLDGKCLRIFGSYQDINLPKSLEIQIRDILESISDAFYGIDINWNFTYFNKEAENLLLKKSEDVIGKNIWDVFSLAKGTTLEEKYQSVYKTGKSETFEYWYPGDGNWYEINAYPSKGGVSVFFKNIDDRRKAAEDLLKAYEEKNKILESIGDAFFTVDKNWIVSYWNKEAEIILGMKREAIVGENLWEIYADAHDTNSFQQYRKALKTLENVNFEDYYPTLNKWFEVSVYPSEEGLSVYFKDVTLRKEADIRLLEANERFEKVTEATNDAIWDFDVANNTLFWGKGFQTLFGYDLEVIKPSFDLLASLIHPDDRERITTKVGQYMQDPNLKNWYEEYRFIKADGSIAFVIDRATFLRNTQGTVVRVIGAMTDISEQKNHEAQLIALNESLQSYAKELERSNEELEQFAFITSHDLQEPLRMISSFMDQLKRKYEDKLDDKALKYIEFATNGSKRMKQIILDLLDYSRAGRPTDFVEEVDVNELIADFKLLRERIISEKSAVISSKKIPIIKTYKTGITQVFHSLLDNAIKYSKKEVAPNIEITFKEEDSKWLFAVKDNGIGIDEKFYSKIFIIFQRLHNREEYEGTGIGLSIVKRHIDFLGGEIWVDSELDKGTTFYFKIPKTNDKLMELKQ